MTTEPNKKALLANLRDGVLDDSATAALTYGREISNNSPGTFEFIGRSSNLRVPRATKSGCGLRLLRKDF